MTDMDLDKMADKWDAGNLSSSGGSSYGSEGGDDD